MKKLAAIVAGLTLGLSGGTLAYAVVTSSDPVANDIASVQSALDQAQSALNQLKNDYTASTSTTTSTTVPTTSTTTPTTTVTNPAPAPIDPHTVAVGSCVNDGAGNIACHNKEWVCPGANQNIASVSVLIDQSGSGDAVKLTNGCSGTIGYIWVEQWQGDGIHVNDTNGLVVNGGQIRCYAHTALKHQDGVQVMGGKDTTFNNLDDGCYSANNSQVWINNGSGGSGPGGTPTNVVFIGGKFQGYFGSGQYGPGGSYGVAINDSVSSGFKNALICPNAHPARQLYIGSSAVSPVNENNTVAAAC